MNDPSKLHPHLRSLYYLHVNECKQEGIEVKATCTQRTPGEQAAFYAQGRRSLAETNELREAAGLPPIDMERNKYPVTWTMLSKHLPDGQGWSHAYDLVVIRDGKAIWDVAAYKRVAEIGKALGLDSGYFWTHRDAPHFQCSETAHAKDPKGGGQEAGQGEGVGAVPL
jgi:hypothetical protein